MIDLVIDNLAFGGRGVGRHEGKAVFVPFTIPGERVRCRVLRDHKRHSEAELVEVLEPAPQRTTPACPVFGECGGCQWQHLPYTEQTTWKERIYRDFLTRALTVEASSFEPVVSSPAEWSYRCRAQIKCRRTENGFVAGFYRAGSHYVVDIEQCPLLAPELNQLFARLRSTLSGFRDAHRVPQLDLAVDDDGRTAVVVHYLETDSEPLRRLLQPLARELSCAVYVQSGRKETLVPLFSDDPLSICPLPDAPMRLHFPPGGFVQVNLEQNRRLVADVVAVAGSGRVLDLFCGIGNFALPLADKVASVTGIEDYEPAVAAARANADRLGFGNTAFLNDDAADGLQKQRSPGRFDTVILDPPRSGAYRVVKGLLELMPDRIVYVSCDPATLARDLKPLVGNGYRPRLFRPYDMFPQTGHIESLNVLERDGRRYI